MSKYDKDIKPGDIIIAYHAGFHKVTKVERRFVTQDDLYLFVKRGLNVGDEYASLIHYQTVLTANGNPPKGKTPKTKSCDAQLCTKIDEFIALNQYADELDAALKKKDNLMNLLEGKSTTTPQS